MKSRLIDILSRYIKHYNGRNPNREVWVSVSVSSQACRFPLSGYPYN